MKERRALLSRLPNPSLKPTQLEVPCLRHQSRKFSCRATSCQDIHRKSDDVRETRLAIYEASIESSTETEADIKTSFQVKASILDNNFRSQNAVTAGVPLASQTADNVCL